MKRSLILAASLTAGLTLLSAPALADTSQATASFRGGSGNYLTTKGSGTDGLRTVTGTEKFTASQAGNLNVTGTLSGLAPSTSYVTVAYKDGYCVPAAGLTAFPSSPFTTDATGSATFTATVNPKGINPLATLVPAGVHSVSVRQLIVGSPVNGVPNVPNVAAVETCDEHPGH